MKLLKCSNKNRPHLAAYFQHAQRELLYMSYQVNRPAIVSACGLLRPVVRGRRCSEPSDRPDSFFRLGRCIGIVVASSNRYLEISREKVTTLCDTMIPKIRTISLGSIGM